MNENYPIVVKTYTFTKWYMKKLATLPKNNRYTFAEKVQHVLLELLMLLSDATYSKDKHSILMQANRELEKLRLLSRLMKDLELLSAKGYRFVVVQLSEIGQMLGGWIKANDV